MHGKASSYIEREWALSLIKLFFLQRHKKLRILYSKQTLLASSVRGIDEI